MAYCTLQDLQDRIGAPALVDLTDRGEEPTGAVDAAVVERAIADAAAVIDGFIGVKYALPMAEVPSVVADLSKSIALYKLHPFQPDEKIVADYKDAISMLRMIAEGKAKLPLPSGEPKTQSGTGARVTDRDRPMTEAGLKSFI